MLDYESLRKRFTETLNSYSKDDLLNWKKIDEQQLKTNKMNNREKEVELVRQSVINFIERNKMSLSPEQENSFLNIGTSILCEKWEVGYAGHSGSFVTSFADNDLRSAVAYADHINIGLLREYMLLWHNAVYPIELINADLLKYEIHNAQK